MEAIWRAYYRGMVRAARRRIPGSLPREAVDALLVQVRDRAGTSFAGRDGYRELLPAMFRGRDLEIVQDTPEALEYRWTGCPARDLCERFRGPTCIGGLKLHEALARTLLPDLHEFRPLAFGPQEAGEYRVLLRFAPAGAHER